MGNFSIRSYVDLPANQMEQMVRLLSHEHTGDHSFHYGVAHGDYLVALLHGEKVIAAIATNGRQKVYNWAGTINREFLKEHGHTAGEELMRHHIFRLGRRNLTYDHGMYEPVARAFDRALVSRGTPIPTARGVTRTIRSCLSRHNWFFTRSWHGCGTSEESKQQ